MSNYDHKYEYKNMYFGPYMYHCKLDPQFCKDLLEQGIIDEIINEPLGGAHRNSETVALDVKKSIIKNLKMFEGLSQNEIYDQIQECLVDIDNILKR